MKQGYIHVYCGDGKGKTTCATGLAVRCAGAGGRVLWFQFLKKDTSSERNALKLIPGIDLLSGYEKMKFTFQMTEEEKKEAKEFYQYKFEQIVQTVVAGTYDLLILDEVIGAIGTDMIEENMILDFLKTRPECLEVVLTGRNPSATLLQLADYVSDIQKVKHPYDLGKPARKMIEW